MTTPFRRSANSPTAQELRKLRFLESSLLFNTAAKPLDDAGRALVEEHRLIAYRMAWKFARHSARDIPVEELIAEALYALTYAAGLFDRKRGVPFPAYAVMVIKHRLIHVILGWRRAKRVGPLPRVCESEAELEPANRPGPDIPTSTATQEMCDRIREVLPSSWFDALQLCYGEDYTFEEIGDHMGISRQRAQQLVVRARRRLQQFFPDWTKF
jgi:RNA polymerase sigma factor (sigma-70 family)